MKALEAYFEKLISGPPRFTDNKKSVYFINQDENIFAKN